MKWPLCSPRRCSGGLLLTFSLLLRRNISLNCEALWLDFKASSPGKTNLCLFFSFKDSSSNYIRQLETKVKLLEDDNKLLSQVGGFMACCIISSNCRHGIGNSISVLTVVGKCWYGTRKLVFKSKWNILIYHKLLGRSPAFAKHQRGGWPGQDRPCGWLRQSQQEALVPVDAASLPSILWIEKGVRKEKEVGWRGKE